MVFKKLEFTREGLPFYAEYLTDDSHIDLYAVIKGKKVYIGNGCFNKASEQFLWGLETENWFNDFGGQVTPQSGECNDIYWNKTWKEAAHWLAECFIYAE